MLCQVASRKWQVIKFSHCCVLWTLLLLLLLLLLMCVCVCVCVCFFVVPETCVWITTWGLGMAGHQLYELE